MATKNHSEELKEAKLRDLTFPLPMELTNISVNYDTEFFVAIEDKNHALHEHAKSVFNQNCRQAFETAEPGFSFNFRKDNETLRNACQPEFASVNLACGKKVTMGQLKVGDVLLNLNNKETVVVKKWSNGTKKVFAYGAGNNHSFIGTDDHKIVTESASSSLEKTPIDIAFTEKKKVLTVDGYKEINNKVYLGEYEVFDITVSDNTHTYLTNGIFVSNCTEVTSEDDSDKCNLGTIWMNRIKDTKDLRKVVKYSTLFLLCGGIYSDVPTAKIKEVGGRNNRIGLGLGGIHEWLMLRGNPYQATPELHKWLAIYEEESNSSAFVYAKALGVSVPKGVRAIAPTGTIGIMAETTTGIEPLFCKAYKRRYYKDGKWMYQYVVDGAVKRLLDKGIALEAIQDTYDLSFKDRVKFQADIQNYVDMAISSTCNLPQWGTEQNNESTVEQYSKILLKYAKRLRGFTCYPDACRGGQPLTRVTLEEALKNEGTVFEEKETECVGGVCGL